MTHLTVAGGVYHEKCIWPEWDQVYGSAGRAAAAVANFVDRVRLVTHIRPDTKEMFLPYLSAYGVELQGEPSTQTISFEYFHSLSTPVITPLLSVSAKVKSFIFNIKLYFFGKTGRPHELRRT